jgi:glutamyl-Q tRNA(Asp) synthetase
VSGVKSSSAIATTGTADPGRPYRGRFAPSPSGPLHFGSLVAAVASFLDARAHGGDWLVRIEDLDPPRERPGAADAILHDLERLGLHWDGPVLRQSTREAAYQDAIDRLLASGLLRRCSCSRAALAALPENRARPAGEDLYHPPECVGAPEGFAAAYALRFRAPNRMVGFVDRAQGSQGGNVAATHGDFVLRRRDGLYAYQLAVVVDDAHQGILDIVRGVDLLASTPRQLLLQEALGFTQPSYMHVPLAVDESGRKLSKSADAPGLAKAAPGEQLTAALAFLGQEPPAGLRRAAAAEVLRWGQGHWRPERFAGVMRRKMKEGNQ